MLKPRAGNRRRTSTRLQRKRAAAGRLHSRRRTVRPGVPARAGQPDYSGGPAISVVIPVVNERRTIERVIRQAFRVHRNTEVIVVANGTTDGTRQLAESLGARVITYPEALGHDVGRSIGAKEAKGKIVLFTDGDIVIPAKDLMPLIKAVENGVDIALNSYMGPTGKRNVHGVVLAKHAMNIALSRPDLRGASMTTIPHALSRRALETIGFEELAVPPKAQAVGICRGLDVRAVHYIDVGRPNPIRRRRQKTGSDPLEQLIIGDHLEAMDWYIRSTNERGNLPDLMRVREIVR
ncbi:glycosyltransferase family 2 protein [Paenibacillus oceani]|uniref:Glycosyltransferase family 2 protein n=1 Tax=Paenibacillus oceani TaxID=2772510 RepID=A0A927C4W1_9BACL|nr:glycosyltransferase family 2 protein [Paenibacillus oceani]MBD2860859.1 glycosyltransferase family 2 protein [Paenibacillus oceani]